MDLAKIISGLRTELQCMNAAIAAMEALEQALNAPGVDLPGIRTEAAPDAPAGKRRRGRPRKHPLPEPVSPAAEPGAGPGSGSPESSLT